MGSKNVHGSKVSEMKWGLKSQLMLPVSTLSFVTIFGLGIWLAWQYARNSQVQIEKRMVQLASTIRESNFPINQSILLQLKGLSGADFLLCNRTGDVVLATDQSLKEPSTLEAGQNEDFKRMLTASQQELRARSLRLNGAEYVWMQVQRLTSPRNEVRTINVLYPMQEMVRQRWQALPPILAACLLAWVLSVVVTAIIADRLAKPLKLLQHQVNRIAAGEFVTIPVPQEPVEIKELVGRVNEMSAQLERTQHSIRESERLQTLSLLAGGIAHQLRNSATGALLALDFAEQSQSAQGLESLAVAKRQLQLMEKYVQKFLTLNQSGSAQFSWVDFRSLLSEIEVLVGPFAKHHEVALSFSIAAELPTTLWAEPDALQDLLLNLLLNAIQAAAADGAKASAYRSLQSESSDPEPNQAKQSPQVRLRAEAQTGAIIIEVRDSGRGLTADIEQRLFEPFATNRLNGIGLGLYVARQAAILHQGEIRYFRRSNETCFSVTLPNLDPDLPPSSATQKPTY